MPKTTGQAKGTEKRVSLLGQGTFWKPTKVGEKVRGKFMKTGKSQYGRVFKLSTAEGPIAVSDSAVLSDLDLDPHIGKVIEFTYKGNKKGYKEFDVDLIESTEDNDPF